MYDSGFRSAAFAVYSYLRSIRKTSKALGISKSTLSKWKAQTQRQKSTRKRKYLQQNIRDTICQLLNGSPFLTCTELRHLVFKHTGVNISRQLVSIALKTYGYSKVKTRNVHERALVQAPRIKEFFHAFTAIRSSDTPVVAVDECGFDSRMLPLKGYSKRGHRLTVADKRSQCWKRKNTIMSISTTGQWDCSVHDRPINSDIFCQFIDESVFPPGTVWIMDNVSFHKSSAVKRCMDAKKYQVIFIPPYCPDANPIENIFGVIKNNFRGQWVHRVDVFENVLCDVIQVTMQSFETFDDVFKHAEKWLHNHSGDGVSNYPDIPKDIHKDAQSPFAINNFCLSMMISDATKAEAQK